MARRSGAPPGSQVEASAGFWSADLGSDTPTGPGRSVSTSCARYAGLVETRMPCVARHDESLRLAGVSVPSTQEKEEVAMGKVPLLAMSRCGPWAHPPARSAARIDVMPVNLLDIARYPQPFFARRFTRRPKNGSRKVLECPLWRCCDDLTIPRVTLQKVTRFQVIRLATMRQAGD